jgi:hypothetical protein
MLAAVEFPTKEGAARTTNQQSGDGAAMIEERRCGR